MRDKYFHNPDVEHHDAYASFMIDGIETDCYLLWICPDDYSKDNEATGFNTETVLVPIDGTDTYYTIDKATNFYEVFGTNTEYVIDPEECMADNFADAMQYGVKGRNGQGYPNTEITVTGDRSFQAAMRLASDNPGSKIAVVNFANAFHAGGGVAQGASAQEECLELELNNLIKLHIMMSILKKRKKVEIIWRIKDLIILSKLR
ncbi:MAG: PARG family protein [Eubacterium sp.]|nr:PARG family protein [Eubacterium sp.]